MKVFISYNHKDQPIALKMRDRLVENGFDVIIDVEKMKAGQDIAEFILQSIRESGVTLSLVSANSLLSAWVAMETVYSTIDEKLRSRYFIPCFVSSDFFDRNFTAKAMEKVEQELAEITDIMKAALDKGWGVEDLQSERTRYNKLKTHLPEIVQKFRNTLSIDLTPDNFEGGMKKIIVDLQSSGNAPATAGAVAPGTPAIIQELRQQINNTIDNIKKQRLESISKRLETLQQLLEKYESERDLESDPKRQLRYDKEIINTQQAIQKIVDEIKTL
jgi:hypothetical protein